MEKCLFCGSEDKYFRKKRKIYVCKDCGKTISNQELLSDSNTVASNNRLELFFSYDHDKNRVIVERIKRYLEARGHHVWTGSSEIKAVTIGVMIF